MTEFDQPTAIALSRDVPVATVIGTRLGELELAVWRDPAGSVHVWEDRCPHRGMRLSLGFLRGANLACPYHGWRFDDQGHCVHVPANPNIALSAVVRRYPVGEAGGLIWLGAAPRRPAGTGVRSVTVRAPAADVRAAMVADPFWADVAHCATSSEGPTAYGNLFIGWQCVDPETTALHLTVVGTVPAGGLAGIARVAAGLRDVVESAVVSR